MKKPYAIVLLAIFYGCAGTPFEWTSARQIKAGMTEREVTTLMGQPYLVKSQPQGITWVWTYVDPMFATRSLVVVFRDGKVVEVPPIPESFK